MSFVKPLARVGTFGLVGKALTDGKKKPPPSMITQYGSAEPGRRPGSLY